MGFDKQGSQIRPPNDLLGKNAKIRDKLKDRT